MASRHARRLVRPFLLTTAAAAGVGGALYFSYRPLNIPGSQPAAVPPPSVTETGHLIPPKFPKIKSRLQQIQDLKNSSKGDDAEPYDLLVIGAGATGSGIALDAATRGLKVAVVERDDFSSGTSSKSTKLVHGGVRYLEKAVWELDYNQYALVKEALRERRYFLHTAPHLSAWLPIMLPVQKWWQIPYFWAGTKCYDFLAGSEGIESSYFLTKSKAIDAFPMLKRDNLVGALVYYDCITERNGQKSPEFEIRAKGVINATGPFADSIRKMDEQDTPEIVAPSEGVHIVLPGYYSPSTMGLIDPSTSDGRVIFFLPWQGYTIAGTTDSPTKITKQPIPSDEDINWILKEIRGYLAPDITVRREDVLAAWCGIRPLVRDPKAKNTESLVRSHLVSISKSGLLTCAGGKWTTYRQMAEDAVDEAVKHFDITPRAIPTPNMSGSEEFEESVKLDGSCKTHEVRLVGAHGYSKTLFINLIQYFGLPLDVAKHLAENYGDRAWEVAALSAPTNLKYPACGVRIASLHPFIDGEIRYAVRYEYAQTAVDVIARRTRLAFLNAQAALEALPTVIDVMAEELNWDKKREQVEWNDSVQFLKSMGLSKQLEGVTRQDVVSGKAKQYA
ncbi:mitochondrial glycerol-3-phosphate dehydrogenase [Ascosphaera aggregata]|nr:mitochondrial glycerol-3-phosphate dehydrogenase [Ascosphaera aggregata]